MDIYNCNGIKLEYSEVLTNLPITESCEHVEELMKADHIVLSWRDSEKYTLPVGAYITYKGVNYALLEPYEPEQKSGDEFEYTPNFQHPKMYLGKVPFRFPTTDTEGNSITLLEWPYSGDIDTLLTFFCRTMESELGLTANTFNYSILGEIDMVVSTTFNAVDILSALSNVANQLKCEWHIDWDYKILYFGHIELSRDEVDETVLEVGVNVGTPSVRSSKEGFYNTYEPQGSTRNISKRAASGEYVQGDVRLALNVEDYPDKVIYTNESGTVIASLPQGVKKYVKPLIFDNIYPKLDLYVYDVRCRERDLLDDNGEKIIDHYNGSTPIYKRYAVWYMRLAYPTKVDGHVTAWTDYTINPETDIISGKNLGGAFQPNNYNGAESFPLAGRGNADDGGYGFELNYHTTAETIPANPNDGDTGVIIKAGDYEIVFQQQNDYILPTTASQGIIPKGVKVNGQEVTDLNGLTNLDDGQKGNIVDLYNIVIGSAYTESAQDELANETLKYITNQFKDNNSYTLKSDVVAFKKRIDQDELLHTDSSLYIGEKVIYKNGDYELETRVMKLVTKLDYAFVQEITVGNEVLKGSTTTLKEQVQTILSGGVGNGSGGGGIDAGAVRKIVQAYANPRFLSKLNDDTAQGFIRMLKGLQVGNQFVSGLLGEGGVFRKEADGTTYLEADKMYIRMKAIFDTLEVRKYLHSGGNRIASPANCKCVRVEGLDSNGQITEVAADIVKYRCYFRGSDGDDTITNDFVIGDQAYCHITNVSAGSLYQHSYWRLVIGKSSSVNADGEHYIDLSNAASETISGVEYSGYQSGSDAPLAQDDIIQLGNVNDSTRRGAIIEYVSGANAPSYQIYQDLGNIGSASTLADKQTAQYSLNNKNYIGLGYDSSTGRAYMNVHGDFRFGSANDNGSYIKYNASTEQLDVKAKINAQSTIGNQSMPDYIKDNQNNYDDTAVIAAIGGLEETTEDLQRQIDGAIETWFMTGVPTLLNEPAVEWTDDDEKDKHIGDLYYDKATGHGYRFMYDDEEDVYLWTILTDEDVTEALRIANEAQATADGKMTIYSVYDAWMKNNVNTLQVGDLYIPTSNYPATGTPTYYAKKVYKCTTNGSATFEEIAYTDDSALHSYIGQILNKTYASGDDAVAAAAQRAIQGALNGGTLVDGGLLLTSLIGMRKYNETTQQYTTWAGISGMFDAQARGNGIAYWAGGAAADMEDMTAEQKAAWDALTDEQKSASTTWAKRLDRFDGSGYFASNSVKWTADGKVYLANLHTSSGHEISQYFFDAFAIGIDGTTKYINPQYTFNHIDIYRRTGAGAVTLNDNSVLNRGELDARYDARYLKLDFFNAIFQLEDANGTAITPNNATTAKDRLKILVGAYTDQYLSALGLGSDSGGGGSTTLAQLNDVNISNLADGQMLVYDLATTHWVNRNIPETYTLPAATSGALGGIKIGYSGTTAKTYAVALDTNGKAYVNVPWTDNDTWIAWVGATENAAGTAGYMPAPTSAQRNQFLRGDGTWVSLNNYSLPLAASGVRGGVQVGYTTDGANRNYAVQLSSEKMYVNVPWENTTYESKSEANGGTAVSLVTTGEKYSWNHKTYTTAIAADSGTNQLSLAANTKYKLTAGGTEFIFTTPADTNTWRNIFNDGTEQLTTGTNTKGLNFTADGKTTITFLAAGTGSGQSGNANYATIKISSTWRGIQDNLTSTSTTDSLSANQGKVLNDKFADYLPLTGGTLTGNLTINPSSGDKFLQIGDIRLVYDSTNVALKVVKSDGTTAANFYATGAISALGQGVDGGGGGQGDVTWALLASSSDTRQIALSHLTTALSGYSTTSHTHTTTIAAGASGDTNQLTLAYGTKYKLTAGGTSFVFTMPTDNNTTYTAGTGLTLSNNQFSINSNVLVQSSVIDTHNEGSTTIILDSANDLYAFYDRGGTCDAYEVEQSATLTAQTLTRTSTGVAKLSAAVFKGLVGYNQTDGVYQGEKFAVYDLALPTGFNWRTKFYWSFGNSNWKPAKMRVLIGKYSANGFTYIQKYSTDSCPAFGSVAIGEDNGFDRLRIVVSKYSRLSCFGIVNYSCKGQNTTYMNRCLDDDVYRNISPAKDNTWSLGTSSRRWKEVRAVNLYGELTGNASTATKLETARTIWGQSFDGSGNITGKLSIGSVTTSHATKLEIRAANITADTIEWAAAIKNPYNDQTNYNLGVGFKFALGAEVETGKWGGIAYKGTGSWFNSGKLSFYVNGSEVGYFDSSTLMIGSNAVIHAGNIGSQSVNYATSAGSVAWGNISSKPSVAIRGEHNDLTASANEFTFASSGFSGGIYINYRTAGGYNGNITEYYLGNGAGGVLGTAIHTGNIGSQSVNYATSAGSASSADYATNSGMVGGYGQSDFLHTTGGTMSGHINMNNSYIYGLDSVRFNDTCDDWTEGLMFVRNNGNWDSIWALDGDFKFTANNGTAGSYSWLRAGGATFTYANNTGDGSNYVLKIVQGTDNGYGGYDTVIISSNDVPALRISDSDGTQLGLSGGDYHGTITSTHDLRFFVGSTANSSIYNGAAGTQAMRILANGDVGIGTSSPSYKLHVSGDIYATGAVTCLSDARKKDVQGNLDLNVEQVANAPAIRFLWKDKREVGMQAGTIAQYWLKVLPEVVTDKSGELSMQYGVTALVAAITTAKKVVDHEQRIRELENENKELREEINRLKIA